LIDWRLNNPHSLAQEK